MNKERDHNVEWTIINLNKKALQLQKDSKAVEGLMAFYRAEELLKAYPSVKLQLFTFNNIACHYIKENSLDLALDYLKICIKLTPIDVSSYLFQTGVLLNLSATKSKLSYHKEALFYALKAFEMLKQCENDCLLALTYYSIGLEYENLGQIRSAEQYFSNGIEFSLKIYGENHELTKAFQVILKQNRKKYTKVDNEICILSDNFPNLRRKSLYNKISKEKTIKFEDSFKIDTTPWIDGDD